MTRPGFIRTRPEHGLADRALSIARAPHRAMLLRLGLTFRLAVPRRMGKNAPSGADYRTGTKLPHCLSTEMGTIRQIETMLQLALSKEFFGVIALFLTFVAFGPYIHSIQSGRTRPHVISWIIWGVGTTIVFFAQLYDDGGYGAWVIGVSGLITFFIAWLSWFKSGDTSITRVDWLFLALAGLALPLWYLTNSALSAVIVLTVMDLLGFGPSVRKAYKVPHEESATFFCVGALRNIFVLLALSHYSWTTTLFPAAVGLACGLFVLLIMTRRSMLVD